MIFLVSVLIIFVILLSLVLFYFEEIKTAFNDLFRTSLKDKPKEIPKEKKQPVSQLHKKENEVFHIADKIFTFEEAKDVCHQYGARLADYDELIHSYQHGHEFCNPGWSQNQLALYPTQKSTWHKLQKSHPRFQNLCGHYGVNGGKFPKHMRFGANCYGTRPEKPDKDFIFPIIPEMKKQRRERKRKTWKELTIAPFNRSRWARDAGNPYLQPHHSFTSNDKSKGKVCENNGNNKLSERPHGIPHGIPEGGHHRKVH